MANTHSIETGKSNVVIHGLNINYMGSIPTKGISRDTPHVILIKNTATNEYVISETINVHDIFNKILRSFTDKNATYNVIKKLRDPIASDITIYIYREDEIDGEKLDKSLEGWKCLNRVHRVFAKIKMRRALPRSEKTVAEQPPVQTPSFQIKLEKLSTENLSPVEEEYHRKHIHMYKQTQYRLSKVAQSQNKDLHTTCTELYEKIKTLPLFANIVETETPESFTTKMFLMSDLQVMESSNLLGVVGMLIGD